MQFAVLILSLEKAYTLRISFSASLCGAAGDGCMADNVLDSTDCDAFEVNGWSGAHVVAGLTIQRSELATAGYTNQSEEAFKVLPMCDTGICKCVMYVYMCK